MVANLQNAFWNIFKVALRDNIMYAKQVKIHFINNNMLRVRACDDKQINLKFFLNLEKMVLSL